MLDSTGWSLQSLTAGPWIYAAVMTSILLDVFLPVLPSGILVVTAATAASATAAGATGAADAAGAVGTAGAAGAEAAAYAPALVPLLLCAATASMLGDLAAYHLARRGGTRFGHAVARSRRLNAAQERLGETLARGGGLLVVLARFAPAGRSVVSLGAGATGRRLRDFLPWSALAAVVWATYGVGLGWLGGRWLGATWLGACVPVLALFLAGSLAAWVIRRPAAAPAPAPAS
ncbi:DedA family protein [Streptomyces roseicoloratus]|uniref:VTT domain-containing protein n=1 Tax=Streptomyces roseicoloratus TaxID=2508722 RepID=A0ABY9S4N4_9ACTN|nr:VTT domain-containing protein [Streptomyces roseicoloratus]WMX49009.1 VTT domain-containing protein [Streptomyces roseicoloratus]